MNGFHNQNHTYATKRFTMSKAWCRETLATTLTDNILMNMGCITEIKMKL